MKCDPNESAHPFVWRDDGVEWCGLTKRELFAAKAMQGYCGVQVDPDNPSIVGLPSYQEIDKIIAGRRGEVAILHADALIAALNEGADE